MREKLFYFLFFTERETNGIEMKSLGTKVIGLGEGMEKNRGKNGTKNTSEKMWENFDVCVPYFPVWLVGKF